MELQGNDKRLAVTASRIEEEKKKKKKRRVLNEEEYTAQLSAILRRDFFPSLSKLEAQYDYLTAMERDDLVSLRAAAARLNNPPTTTAPTMTLDEFQSRFVTEDTAEFEELLERVNATRRGRFAKVFKREAPLMLEAAPEVHLKRGKVCKENTRLEKRIELGVLEKDTTDLRHHYWRMRKEYSDTIDGDSVSEVTLSSKTKLRGYSFVETPMHSPERRFRIPETPSRETLAHHMSARAQKSALLKTPAVQRLLRAHTPKIGSVFETPKTPKRKKEINKF